MEPNKCPIEGVDEIEGEFEEVPGLRRMRLRKALVRLIPPELRRRLKKYRNRLRKKLAGQRPVPSPPPTSRPPVLVQVQPPPSPVALDLPPDALRAGDAVRIRSLEEIQALLDHRGKTRGLRFMPEMAVHCGTRQRVFKRLDRFFDEVNLTVKQSSGVVLLENLFCQGVESVGRCDRSCFFFWREEWLERLEKPGGPGPKA